MSLLTRQVISEQSIILWLLYTVAASIVSILIAGVIVYALYDCWPVTRYLPGSNACLANIKPDYLVFAPIMAGLIIGTLLTVNASHNNKQDS